MKSPNRGVVVPRFGYVYDQMDINGYLGRIAKMEARQGKRSSVPDCQKAGCG